MIKSDWLNWLKSQQIVIDDIIAKAGFEFFKANEKNLNFWYDMKSCQQESFNLIKEKDLCYDRVTTPLSYSLWYQGRRINTFLSHFIDQLIEIEHERSLDIFDLGAGTGAIQMSIGLIYHKLKIEGKSVPRLRIFNIDTSPFMLAYNRDMLWLQFQKIYPEAKDILTEYHVNSWNNSDNIELNNTWLSASYLFDISDDKEQIKEDFLKIVAVFKPSNILLLTSDQPIKRKLLEGLSAELIKTEWKSTTEVNTTLLFEGIMPKVNALRTHYSNIAGDNLLGKYTQWTDKSFISSKFTLSQARIGYNTSNPKIKKIDLYNPPLKIRTDILLSDDQKKAAQYSIRPSVIIGPAGCGKSVVITERVINIIKFHTQLKPINILLTTFNKELLKKLVEWLLELLKVNNYQVTTHYDNDNSGSNRGSATINDNLGKFSIRLLHFEMLAHYIGDIKNVFFNPTHHESILIKCIQTVVTEKNIKKSDYEDILNVDFLFEEYHRVIYGLQCKISDGIDLYQNIARTGRGSNPSLHKGLRRELVWSCLNKYAREVHQLQIQSFTSRRQSLLHQIRKGNVSHKFDYIVVDEFQDCTPADFEIFWGLLTDVNHLIIAGDIAQAIHIGRSAKIPRNDKMSNWEFFRLKGSYRLPQRISECIQQLSIKIKEAGNNADGIEEITPYKGSPPGARPIVVYGDDLNQLALKIKSIFNSYSIYGINKVTVLEKDKQLHQLLTNNNVSSETDTILKLKGLEKGCVVWSTRGIVEFEKEAKEFVYTILTRTSCILIIAFLDDVCDQYKEIFSLLNNDRLIYWDEDSELQFKSHTLPFVERNGDDE